MTLETAIDLTALLSDAQELFLSGRNTEGRNLLNEAKRRLLEEAHQDANTDLSFEAWLRANNTYFFDANA